MKKLRITICFLFLCSLSLIFSQYILAEEIDCDQLVEDCVADNPYSYFLNPGEWFAYNSGCSNAGNICTELQKA